LPAYRALGCDARLAIELAGLFAVGQKGGKRLQIVSSEQNYFQAEVVSHFTELQSEITLKRNGPPDTMEKQPAGFDGG
jgi:hypothetical protein